MMYFYNARKRNRLLLFIALLVMVFLTACGKGSQTANNIPSSPEKDSNQNKQESNEQTNPSATQGNGSDATPEKIRIMVGGLEKIIYLPAKLTEQLGYFKDEGLNVELLTQPSGVNAAQALIAGEVQGVVGFYDHTIDLQSKGKYLMSVVQLGSVPGSRIMVANKLKDEVKQLSDLKGRNIGVTNLGASSHFLINYLIRKSGLKTEDYVPVPVGSGNTLIASMEQGKVDAAWATQPTIALLEKRGIAFSLVDMESVEGMMSVAGSLYPSSCLYMSADYVKQHPEIVQKLANAFVKTLAYIQTHSAEEIAELMPKEYYAGDKELYIQALASSLHMFTTDGIMPEGGPESVLEVLSTSNDKIDPTKIDLKQTYTTEFVEKAKSQ